MPNVIIPCVTLPCYFSRCQAPPLLWHPPLDGKHSTEVPLLQRHYFDSGRVELRHLEGRRHGNNTCRFSQNNTARFNPRVQILSPLFDIQEGPIILSPNCEQSYTAACWSLSRPAVFFVGKGNGSIEVWNLLEESSEAVHIQEHVTSAKITCMKPWTLLCEFDDKNL